MERLPYLVPIVLYAILALDHLIPKALGAWVLGGFAFLFLFILSMK